MSVETGAIVDKLTQLKQEIERHIFFYEATNDTMAVERLSIARDSIHYGIEDIQRALRILERGTEETSEDKEG